MTMRRLYCCALLALPIFALADEDPEMLRRCATLNDDAARLDCYDEYAKRTADRPATAPADAQRTADRSATAPAEAQHMADRPPADPADAPSTGLPPADPPPADSPSVATVSPRPAADEAVARFGLPAVDEEEKEPDEISAVITRIEVRRNGERIFTLDNGQIWVEDSPKPALRLKVGDRVHIKSGLFGSYRLFGSGHRSSGVDRVR